MSLSPAPTSPARAGLARRAVRWVMPALLLAFAVGLWQRDRLWVWYCAERLERASDDRRPEWAEELMAVGEPAVPTMFRLLRHDDPGVCVAASRALKRLAGSWPVDDPRRLDFARQFVAAEPRFSTPGRAAALELLPFVLDSGDREMSQKAKGVVGTAAKSESVDVRIQAVATALRPEIDALEQITGLINDPDVGVRRAAVLALGPVRDGAAPALGDDELLKCLHDPDDEVRRLCEMGLRSRGRSPRDIRLGRRYTAPDPAERQKLLLDLTHEDELDVAVWLERLTADPDPAIRA